MKTLNEVIAEYNALPSDAKILVLYNAIDWMERYNGRSKQKCIALGMGYKSNWCDETNEEKYSK